MQFEVYEGAVYREGEPQSKEVLPAVQKAEIPKLDAGIALWLIFFVFGGGLLALYYAGISYFPEVSWQDALTFMALMTIIGGSLLLAYSFLLFVPGAIWSEFLICDGQLNKVLTMAARPLEPCVWTISKQILFPFTIFMAFCHFLLYEGGSPRLVPWGAAALLAAVSGLLGRSLREKLEPPRSQSPSFDEPKSRSTLRWHRISICASHFPFFVAFIAKAYFQRRPGPELLWVIALLPLVSCAALLLRSIAGRHSLQASWLPFCSLERDSF